MTTTNAEQVLTAALTLPEDDRVKIAEQLLASIDVEAEREVAAAWAAEIERREADVLAGRGESRDWREALRDIERRVLTAER